MNLRIFLYKPGESVAQTLAEYLESFGHEVAVVGFPQTCLQYHSPENICSATKVCADAIILGPEVLPEEGLAMLEKRIKARCQGAKNNAIISFDLTDENRLRANNVGCTCLGLPLDLAAVGEWLAAVEKKINQQRELSPFTIGSTAV